MKHINSALFKQKALEWGNSFEVCCFLDSNSYADNYGTYDWVLAAGATQLLQINCGNAFDTLQSFYEQHKTAIFGFLSYDLKNELEHLTSKHPDHLNFPDLFFFVPEYLITAKEGIIEVAIGDDSCLGKIENFSAKNLVPAVVPAIQSRLTKTAYLEKIQRIKEHIKRGDIYEMNFCQEFYAENTFIHPLATFKTLNKLSPTPFASYFKVGEKYILSASPERFLSKNGNILTSQPIKGTARRSADILEDERIKEILANDPKEQAENVMIVDLVRNDLTKTAVKGSVKATELFGVYSFPQVHQLISTISSKLDPKFHWIDALKTCFPMGSMTGAPKVSAMEIIEQHEVVKRGLYAGTIGWINEAGDFDFNVIIRTILYNSENQYLSFQVGGAITYASNAESEYEECLLKASAIKQALSHS